MAIETDAGSGSEKRVVSIRKVQANRQNALKSTGPRTPQGKAYSRRNAYKDGLFAMGPRYMTVRTGETMPATKTA